MSFPAAETPAITPHKTMRGHTDWVKGVTHLLGGQHIVTCSRDGSLRLWDLKSGAQVGGEWRDEGDEAGVRTMALCPNGRIIASGSSDGTVRLWDVETRKVIAKYREHTTVVQSVCWSPDGEQVVSGSDDGTARVWHVMRGEPVRGLNPVKTEHQHVYVVSYSPKSTKIGTGGYNGGIKIWGAKTGKLLSTIEDRLPVWSLTWTWDEKKLIFGLIRGSIKIFDTATWQQIAVLEGHTRGVYSITLFRNNRLLASTSWDKTARLWDLDTNLQVGSPLQHKNDVECAAFSADGKLLSTACHNCNAYVWDVQSVLKATGLEDLLSIPYRTLYTSSGSSNTEYISPPESSHDIDDRSFLEADATRGFDHLGGREELPPGFFDDTQPDVHAHSSATPDAHPNLSALLGRLYSLLRRSRPNEATETQQPPVPSESRFHALLNHLSPHLRSPRNTNETSELPQPPILSHLHPQVLLSHLSSLFPRPGLYTNEATEPQRSETPSVSRPGALMGRLSSVFHSPPNADEAIELQHHSEPITSSHCDHHDVDVAAMRDREVIFVAPHHETASEKARRIKNPTPWVRVVLFLCCVSPGTDTSPDTDETRRRT
ncbi:WD40-repeat-containing domain protein [Suillus subaureus]|uniref:WD40-repeat-containing domain protein n=1 Tax=Suillus subaureus TaxID=48587 RepID=A0A9P7DXW3_9AGAM|nr:WD40-repeat-containing domain protein [Suillus subaureus]KAG1806091.1 WD40-repeat-containing domain protein [Suillus subaureus]